MNNIIKTGTLSLLSVFLIWSCQEENIPPAAYGSISETSLIVKQNKDLGTIAVYRKDGKLPIVVANAKQDHRP